MDSMKSSIHRKYVLKYVLPHRCTMYIYGYAHSSPTLKFKPLFMINVPLQTTFFVYLRQLLLTIAFVFVGVGAVALCSIA